MEQNKNRNPYKLPLIMALVSAFSMIIGMRFQESLVLDGLVVPLDQEYSNSILEVSNHIKHKYYGDLNDTTFTDAVIGTMVEQLDPYSHYFEEERNVRYSNYMEGLFTGIGVDFVIDEDSVFIYRVLPQSPAEDAGIQKGHILLSIDSIPIGRGTNFRNVLDGIQKDVGAEINIKTYNPVSKVAIDTTLVVESIEVPLVHHYILADDVADKECHYFKIDRFYKSIFVDFMDLIDQNSSDGKGVENMIIDLRDNPGGVVEETTKLLNQFVSEKGKLLLSTNSKTGKVKEYLSNGRSFFDVERIVILQNERSASASEILAGVLQDYDRAILIGTDSYGKGFIQQNIKLSNEGSLNLSVGEYILPGGRTIRRDTVSKDSTFLSLINKRALRGGRGVPVDLILEECAFGINVDSLAKDLVVKARDFDQLFTYDMIHERLPQSIKESVSADCLNDMSKLMSWIIALNVLEPGGTVHQGLSEPWIQEAFRLVQSDRYTDILDR